MLTSPAGKEISEEGDVLYTFFCHLAEAVCASSSECAKMATSSRMLPAGLRVSDVIDFHLETATMPGLAQFRSSLRRVYDDCYFLVGLRVDRRACRE